MARAERGSSNLELARSPTDPSPTPDRAAWAWEWLRRNPHYRSAVRWAALPDIQILRRTPPLTVLTFAEPSSFARAWGLIAPEVPDRAAGSAQVFWRPDVNPGVLGARVEPSSDGESVNLIELACTVTVLQLPGEEHVRLSDGLRSIQFFVRDGTVLNGPVQVRFGMPGHGVLTPRLDTMRRFAALLRTKRFPHSLFAPPPHAVWWAQALTAFDAAQIGLPRREIAARLFGAEAAAQHWPAESEWMRSRVRRAMQMGEMLVNGGYRKILNPSGTRPRATEDKPSNRKPPTTNGQPRA